MRRIGVFALVLTYILAERWATPRLCDRWLGAGAWQAIQDELSHNSRRSA